MSVLCICLCLLLAETSSFYMPKISQYPTSGNTGYPSIVTPFIANNDMRGGRRNCSVKPLIGWHKSYAGYFTVRTTVSYKTNYFFWYFPRESRNVSETPLVLYLQGGTGVSSLFSVFEGNGPYYLDPINGTVKLNQFRLTRAVSVVYIDHPAGAGYSFTGDEIGYSYTKEETSENLINALRQLYLLFPELMPSELYIYGESYSASYVPALVRAIRKYNIRYNPKCPNINIKGVIIGSTFFSPMDTISCYSRKFNELGLIGLPHAHEFDKLKFKIDKYMEKMRLDLAFKTFDKMILGGMRSYPTLFQEYTNYSIPLNIAYTRDPNETYHEIVAKFIQSDDIRRALHIGNRIFHTDYKRVLLNLGPDVMQNCQPGIEMILRFGLRVMLFHGQLDPISPYTVISEKVRNLHWATKLYNSSRRSFFYVNYKVAGYFKRYANLMELLVLDAGHLVSKDQPEVTKNLIVRFMFRKIF